MIRFALFAPGPLELVLAVAVGVVLLGVAAAVVAAMSLSSKGGDGRLAEMQDENLRLREENRRLREELDRRRDGTAPPS